MVLTGLILLARHEFRADEIQAIHRIGFSDSPPLLLAHPDGSPGGLAYDVLTAAAAKASLRLDWRLSRKLNHEFLREGEADLWPLADPGDSGGFGVTRPWIRGSFAMMSLAETRDAAMLVAVNGNARAVALLTKHSPAAARREVDGAAAAMSAMCKGEVTHAFMNARVAQRLLLSRPEECQGRNLRVEPAVGAEMPLGIMYGAGHEGTANALRNAIDQMALEGSLAHAFARWSDAASSSVELDGLLAESAARENLFRWTAAAVLVLLIASVIAGGTLYRARNLALDAGRAKANFVAAVSHELRTPLNGLLGMAELLANSPLKPEQKELAETIRASAHSFQSVVNDVLEFSRIETGKLHIDLAPCDLNGIVAEAVASVASRAKSKGLEVRTVTDPSVRDFLTDGVRLRQILTKLLDNAVKFTHEGSVSIRVRGKASAESKHAVSIEVSDTGIGIAPSKAAGLFTPFSQANGSQSRRFGGLGLGLTISKGIVDAMGGSIAVSSQPGLGTTVTVELVLETAPASVLAGAREREPGGESQEQVRSLRVLVVDDSRANRLVASRILQKLGCWPEEAANGREAVEMARLGEYEMILMDCQMPEMDGLEATRRIRAAASGGRRVPIVALTASVEPADQGLCFEAGMDGFLQKPVSLEAMRQVLAKFARYGPHCPPAES